MFNDLEQVKSFIEWCKANHVLQVEVDGFKLSLSAYANLPAEDISQPVQEFQLASSETLADTEKVDAKDDEEALFWSAR